MGNFNRKVVVVICVGHKTVKRSRSRRISPVNLRWTQQIEDAQVVLAMMIHWIEEYRNNKFNVVDLY